MPTPLSTKLLIRSRVNEGGNSQNLMLFIRGKAISGLPSIKGTNQFPNPPIIMGITIKKIITKAWAVTVTLYSWSSFMRFPGDLSSDRIITLREVPTTLAQAPKIKYKVPISLWLVENNQRVII